jgi:hypothetical protein
MIAVVRNTLPSGTRISNLEALKKAVDDLCERNEREVVVLALDVLEVPAWAQTAVLKRWEAARHPSLSTFAPYTTHVFKVDLLYYLGIDRGFISGERASNEADMAYLYYLPFTMVFVSGDRLHRRTAPLFLTPEQSYVNSDDFKVALREIDDHHSELPEEIRQLGVLQFAGSPIDALNRELDRVRREQRIPRSLSFAELVDAYLAQHDVQPVTLEKLRWLLGKANAVFGDRRIGELTSQEIAEWRMNLSPGYRFEATQAVRQVLSRAGRSSRRSPLRSGRGTGR